VPFDHRADHRRDLRDRRVLGAQRDVDIGLMMIFGVLGYLFKSSTIRSRRSCSRWCWAIAPRILPAAMLIAQGDLRILFPRTSVGSITALTAMLFCRSSRACSRGRGAQRAWSEESPRSPAATSAGSRCVVASA
jgi:TctA family transporter